MNLEDAPIDEDFFAGFDKQSIQVPRAGFIDQDAIAWAIMKLAAFGVTHNTQENAMMTDRLRDMLR